MVPKKNQKRKAASYRPFADTRPRKKQYVSSNVQDHGRVAHSLLSPRWSSSKGQSEGQRQGQDPLSLSPPRFRLQDRSCQPSDFTSNPNFCEIVQPRIRPRAQTEQSEACPGSGAEEVGSAEVEIVNSGMAPAYDQRHHHHHQQQNHQQQSHGLNRADHNTTNSSSNVDADQHLRERDRESNLQQHRRSNGATTMPGSAQMPNHIQVAKPYVFQQAIEGCLKDVGVAQAREDNIRLAGVQWIDDVRRALKLPVRTFDTAVVYYHKFRLVHSDGEYSFVDAAAAALFAACKIEDTLKKSRDILCAAHNRKISRAEHLSPDDQIFEHSSRAIIGLERLMLEASSFDFRNRHPQHLMIKLAKYYGLPRSTSIVKTAFSISLDLYRTFAPLKQNTATLAFACLELSGRLLNELDQHEGMKDIASGHDYDRWGTSRSEVMETLLDLLELYTHYRTHTTVGSDFAIDTFLEVRIPLNEELNERDLPRFTEYIAPEAIDGRADPAGYAATVNGVSAATVAAITSANGTKNSSPTSPHTPSTAASGRPNGRSVSASSIRQKMGDRGREGTVRFILNPDREREERDVVAEYTVVAGDNAAVTSTTTSTSVRQNQNQNQNQNQHQNQNHNHNHSQNNHGQSHAHIPSDRTTAATGGRGEGGAPTASIWNSPHSKDEAPHQQHRQQYRG